jgi:hypothetical protein
MRVGSRFCAEHQAILDRVKGTFSRKFSPASLPGSAKASHVPTEAAAAPEPKRTLAAEYRDKILQALAVTPLTCAELAKACGCPTSNRSFMRARQALVAKGEVSAEGKSKARIFALPAA